MVHPLTGSQEDQFTLTIVAQNSQFSCHRGRVNIRIIVIRDRVEFPDLEPVSVPEDAANGTEIAVVEALSGGVGVAYSFAIGGDGGGVFTINTTSGVISIASPLNFELVAAYNLTIVGTTALTGSTGSVVLHVEVLDVNERPSFLTPCALPPPDGTEACVFSVLENLPNGTVVDVLTGTDPDFPSLPNGQFTFDLVETVSAVNFTVEQFDDHAIILTTGSFDREQTTSFSFIVRVTDNGTPPLSCDVTVTVSIEDENDNAPEFVQAPVVLKVLESTASGELATQYIAVDADIGTNAEITYTLVPPGDDEVPFAIHPGNGVLTVNGSLDFESRTNFLVTVVASNPDGLQSNMSVVILIVDVNDNPPIFSQDIYTGSVKEGAMFLYSIVGVAATDADSGLNRRIVFTIEEGNFGGLLAIDNTVNFGLVVVNGDIDRETIDMFILTIRATDMGTPTMSDSALILINVTDVNDNPPIFTSDSYSVSVREDTLSPDDLVSFSAFDADQPQTNNSAIDFTLDPATNIGGVFDLVAVDDNTAMLRLIGQLDFEEEQTYELRVVATDRGFVPMSNEVIIRVNVTNHNEFPPEVSGNQTIVVSEAEEAGSRIAQVNVTDLDMEVLNFTIVGVVGDGAATGNSDLSLFSVDAQGFVTINRQLDFEISQSYRIVVHVSDGELSDVAVITVIVGDVNEFDPTVVVGAVFSVQEEEPNGTYVGTVTASDGDAGPGATLTFALIHDSAVSALFSINPLTGDVFTEQVLDREELVAQDLFLPALGSQEQVRVVVMDSGVPSRSTIAQVGVVLVDINDNAPVMQDTPLVAFVSENMAAGTIVVTVSAVDSDLGENGRVLEYAVSVADLPPSDPAPFRISTEGVLETAVVLDAEAVSSYHVNITATDAGNPALSVSVNLSVSVSDINDNAPVFTQTSYVTSVPENTTEGVVAVVQASDRDQSELNSRVVYSIQSVVPAGSFSIDSETGEVRVQGGLDFESVQTYTLVISARDQGAPQMSTLVPLTVQVTNIDEVPPRFLAECTISIFEELAIIPGSSPPIGQCIAADISEVTGNFMFGVPLVYEILSGNVNDTFRVGSDGTVFLEVGVDREERDTFSIVLRVSDPSGLAVTTPLTVTVLDINDNTPTVLNMPLTRLVTTAEIQAGEEGVVTVLALDSDIGVNAELVFSVAQVEVALDGLGAVVMVTVSDSGLSPLSTSTNVTVSFEEPCYVQAYTIGESDGSLTGQYICSVSIGPMNPDVVVGVAFELLCSALTNVEVVYEFRHNGTVVMMSSGSLFWVTEATFDSAGDYSCAVSFAEVGSLTSDLIQVITQGM